MGNKIALIEFPQTAETVSKWEHYSELKDVVCTAELQNLCTKDGHIVADPVFCPNITIKYVCSIVLLDSEGCVEQSQTPALGLTPCEGGAILNLTGFCLFSEDLGYYDDAEDQIASLCKGCNPCKIFHELECCLMKIALSKDDKAGLSFMETSITFRKRDIGFIERLRDRYENLCVQDRTCHNGRRYPLRIVC